MKTRVTKVKSMDSGTGCAAGLARALSRQPFRARVALGAEPALLFFPSCAFVPEHLAQAAFAKLNQKAVSLQFVSLRLLAHIVDLGQGEASSATPMVRFRACSGRHDLRHLGRLSRPEKEHHISVLEANQNQHVRTRLRAELFVLFSRSFLLLNHLDNVVLCLCKHSFPFFDLVFKELCLHSNQLKNVYAEPSVPSE